MRVNCLKSVFDYLCMSMRIGGENADRFLSLQVFGTGWRKNRDESNKPIFWDGENNGGKALMKLRAQLKETHVWAGPYEEQVR